MQSNQELNAKPLSTNYIFANTPLKTYYFNKILSHMLDLSSTTSTSTVLGQWHGRSKQGGVGGSTVQNTHRIPSCFSLSIKAFISSQIKNQNPGNLSFQFHK